MQAGNLITSLRRIWRRAVDHRSTGTFGIAIVIGVVAGALALPGGLPSTGSLPGVSNGSSTDGSHTAAQLRSGMLRHSDGDVVDLTVVTPESSERVSDGREFVAPEPEVVEERAHALTQEATPEPAPEPPAPEPTPEPPPPPPAPEPANAPATPQNAPANTSDLQPGDRVQAPITFYYCDRSGYGDGGGFCGAMRNGVVVHPGAAACAAQYLGQRFRIAGDPLGREYYCADTGSAVHGFHRDIWFMTAAEGIQWQGVVGHTATIEILP